MKKIISVLLILCVVAAAFAADTGVSFKGISAVDSRSPAMGGPHVADTSDYFTLLRNPAGLAFSGRHNLIAQTNINIGGPIEEAYNIFMDPEQMAALESDQGMINIATDLIGQKKLNVGLSLGGPIAFGGTYKNGFGWGVFDQVKVNVNAPSSIVKADAELDLDFVLGYGHSLDFGILGEFAFGVSADMFAQAPYLNTRVNLTDLLLSPDNPEALLTQAMAVKASGGMNVNAGVQYRFLGFLNAAIVYNSFLSVYENNEIALDLENIDPAAILAFDAPVQTDVGKGSLDIGVGIDLPTDWSLGLISSLGVYADIKDVFGTLKADPLQRNPILNTSIGAEIELLKCISLRGGISDTYLNAGVGLRLLGLHIDASVYGKELGIEPGATPQMNCALSIGIRH